MNKILPRLDFGPITWTETLKTKDAQLVLLITLAGVFVLWLLQQRSKSPNVPFVKLTSSWDFQWRKAKAAFSANCIDLVMEAFNKVGMSTGMYARNRHMLTCFLQVGQNTAFRIISDQGELLVLPSSLANEIKNLRELNFGEFHREVSL